MQLASCIQVIVAQQLLPRLDSEGRVLATEVLVGTAGVRNQIRERKMNLLRNTIETSRAQGMHLMDHKLRDLYQQGIISYEVALSRAHNSDIVQQAHTSSPNGTSGGGEDGAPTAARRNVRRV